MHLKTSFAQFFMAGIERKMHSQSKLKPRVWKRYVEDLFSLWDVRKQSVYIEQANTFHRYIQFTSLQQKSQE